MVDPEIRLRWTATVVEHFPRVETFVSRVYLPHNAALSIAWSIGGAVHLAEALGAEVTEQGFEVGHVRDDGTWIPGLYA